MKDTIKMADSIKSKFKKAFNHTKSEISQQISISNHDDIKDKTQNVPYQFQQQYSTIRSEKLNESNTNLDEIMANMDLKRICSFSHPSNLRLDPRDQRVLIPFQSNYYSHLERSNFSISFESFHNQICDWLIDVIEIITSISFNHMKMETLTDIQAKAFACKNILLNIKNLFDKYPKIPLQYRITLMDCINQSAKNIFQNIIFKYPQNNSCGASKRIKSRIPKINDMQSDEFDFLLKNNIQIKYRQDGDYSQDIMKVINKLSTFTNQTFDPNDDLLQTNYEVFAGIMEYIFENCNIQSAASINKQISRVIHCKKNPQQDYYDIDNLLKNQSFNIVEEDTKRSSFIKDSHKKYSIGQKIPIGTEIFSEEDMEGSKFHIHDSSILRLLTKWSDQLKNKLDNAEEAILKRLYKFKNSNGKFINLESDLRAKLYEAAISQSKKMKQYFNYLKKQNNVLLTLFAQEQNKMKYGKNDSKVGLFAAKINKISGHYIFRYINKIIHSLLTIPKLASLDVISDHNRLLVGSVNLVTFKIGDLMRSKCSCSQQEFIKILMILEELHQKSPNILKIIRVKNRLQQKNNDILINLFFMNKVECQLQLSITGHSNKNEKNTSNFEHFLYQILRSSLGPISQMATILVKFDPLINLYYKEQSYRYDLSPHKMSEYKKKQWSDKIQERVKLKLKYDIVNDIELPFICSVCHNLSIVHTPYLLFRDPNSKTIQCDDCCLMELKQKQKANDVKSVVQYMLEKQDIIDQDQKKFFTIHILFRNIEQLIKEAQSTSQKMINLKWLTKRGYILRRYQKTPKLQLYTAIYDSVTQNVIFAKKSQDGIKKVISKIYINRDKTKRIENYQRQFKKMFLFELNKCKEIIQDNIIYYECFEEGCCNLKFKAGLHLSTYEIIEKTHRVMIEDSIENKISVLYLSSISQAFDKLEKVMTNIVSGPKIQKIKNNIEAIEANLCNLENIHIVSKFRNLFQLNIRDNPQIRSLKGIENCLQLKFLNCKKCSINDLNELTKLVKLQYLNISYNKQLKCLRGLQNHQQLLQLFLGNTSVDSLIYLQGCVNLESLSLRNCTQITSLGTVKSQKLSYLNVVNCNKLQLFDLPLLALKSLKSLQIYHQDYPQTITQHLILASLRLIYKQKPNEAISKVGSIIKRKTSKIIEPKQQEVTVSQTYMQNKSFVNL